MQHQLKLGLLRKVRPVHKGSATHWCRNVIFETAANITQNLLQTIRHFGDTAHTLARLLFLSPANVKCLCVVHPNISTHEVVVL